MENMEQLQNVAIKNLIDFFNGPKAVRESKSGVINADMAVRSLAAVGRLKATDRARDSMQLTVLKSISTDKDEFHGYIKVAMPHLNPPKLISSGRKKTK